MRDDLQTRGRRRPSVWIAGAALVGIVGICILFPAAIAIGEVVRMLGEPAGEPPATPPPGMAWLAVSTLGWCGGIAAIATVLAWPAAWTLRRPSRANRATAALVLVPLLLPSYLAYAGWGLLRAPDSPFGIGDWLGRQQPWVAVLAGKAMAVWGLSLWAWPLGVMTLTAAARRVPDSVLEALRLDEPPGRGGPGTWLRRTASLVSLMRGGLIASLAIIALVMAGSAVPLHLAQVETWSIIVWRDLNLTTDPARVWLRAWPPMVLAVVAAWVITSRLTRQDRDGLAPELPAPAGRRAMLCARITTFAVWIAAVLAPLGLFATSLREHPKPLGLATMWKMIEAFWRVSVPAVVSTLEVSAAAAGVGMVVGLLIWAVVSIPAGRSRSAVAVAVGALAVLLVSGLAPGVMVGSSVQVAWNRFDAVRWVADSSLIVVLGLVARFAFVTAAVGWSCAAAEGGVQRDMRLADGGDTLAGWAATRLWSRTGLGTLVGAALAVGLLGFQEIEASVILQPPGVESLPKQILDNLHFARDERLGAAAVSLLGAGIVAAFFAGWLVLPVVRLAGRERSGAGPKA